MIRSRTILQFSKPAKEVIEGMQNFVKEVIHDDSADFLMEKNPDEYRVLYPANPIEQVVKSWCSTYLWRRLCVSS